MSIMDMTLREAVADYEVHISMSYKEYLNAFDEDVHAEWGLSTHGPNIKM